MFGGADPVSMIFALVMLFGGGPAGNNDLLDLVPTTSYWQVKNVAVSVEQLERDAAADPVPENVEALIKGLGAEDFKTRSEAKAKLEAMGAAIAPQVKPATESKDPEVASAAAALMKTFAEGSQARAIRRLMAIRTLGERKEKLAEPLLQKMSGSKELFVGEYAARAVAQIEGRAFIRASSQKELLGDLHLLPADTGVVAEAVGIGGPGLSMERFLDQTLAMQAGMMAPMGMPAGKVPDKNKLMARLTREMLKGLEGVGNFRIDGMMVGVAKDVGPKGGWVIISLRGEYDREAVLAMMKTEDAGNNVKFSREGAVDCVEVDGESRLLLPSSKQLVLVSGSAERVAAVAKNVTSVLNGAPGVFAQNVELGGLILGAVDTNAPVWGAARINKDMQGEKILEGFDAITLTAKSGKDGASFVFTGNGSDVEKVKSSAGAVSDGVQAMLGQIRPMVPQMKPLQAVVDLLESLKVSTEEKTGTLSGVMKPAFVEAAVVGISAEIFGEFGDEDEAGTQPAAPDQ